MKKPENQKRIKEEITKENGDWENWVRYVGFDHIYTSFFKKNEWKELEGKSIAEITTKLNKSDDWDIFFELLIEEKAEVIITIVRIF